MTTTPETDDLARGNHVVPTEFAQDLERERNELAQALKAILFFCEEDQQFASKPYRAAFLHAQKLVTRHTSLVTSP